MEFITLNNSDLKVSRLCFGGCPMGMHGWGKVSKDDLMYAVNMAVDSGVNFFDTADVYGLGESEKTLGMALQGKRNKAVIATKFGVRIEDGITFYDNSREWIEKAVHNSLKRLKTDYIDLYQVHYRDGLTPMGDVVETLERLKEKGLIKYYGISNVSISDLEDLRSIKGHFSTFQDEYSLACRKNENDIIELSRQIKANALTWGSLGQGILSGKYDKETKFDVTDRRSRDIYVNFHGEKLEHNLKIVEAMKEISRITNKSVPSIALRWILDFLEKSVVIVGIKNKQQLESNMLCLGWNLSDEHIKKLEEISDYRRL